ncbi:hypothetical protein Btru_067641 [Bulinus truncatus]|nr:hypothetical protein Btru_067641 [Bulinus truncatus]
MPTWSSARLGGLLTTLCGILALIESETILKCNQSNGDNRTIYDYSVKDIHGSNVVNLSDYRGQVVMIVNVATY